MATNSNSRDVELRIAAKATGNDKIVELADDLLDMGKSAGDAAPRIEELTTQVVKLGQQNAAVKTFESLTAEVDKTATELFDAKQKVEALGAEFQQQTATVDQYKKTQAEARAAVKQTGDELDTARLSLRRFKEDSTAADRATVGYKEKVNELRAEVRRLEDQLTQQKGMVDSKAQYNATTKELGRLAASYLKAQEGVSRLDNELTQQNAKLDAGKSDLKELGIVADELSVAQQALGKSASEVVAAFQTEQRYAQMLQQELLQAAAAERELGAVKAIEQKRQEAIKLQQAAEYVAFWTDSLNKAEAAERELVQQSQRAAQALNEAFRTTGVRSAREIENEIRQINQALQLMASSGEVTGKEFDRAFATSRERVQALQRELQGLPPKLGESNALVGTLRQSLSQLTAAFGAFEAGRAFIDANNQFETLRRTMTLLTGSSQTAGEQIQFLRDTANRTGLSIGALSQDFVNFSASAQTSGISLERQREVFTAVATAAGKLGLSTDRVGLILQALAQTANKGKVQLEELQGQLGESLPGALSIVANGLGVTKERLLDMVKAGIDASTFFDAFTRGSKIAFGDGEAQVTSFAAAFNRLKNAFNEFASRAADTTSFKLLVSAIDGIATNFDRLATGVKVAAEAFALFKLANWIRDSAALSVALNKNTIEQEANAVATRTAAVAKEADAVATQASTTAINANTAAAVANKTAMGTLAPVVIGVGQAKEQAAKSSGVLATAMGAATGAFGAMRSAASGLLSALGGIPGVAALVLLNAKELGTAIGEGAARMVGWGKVLDDNEKKLAAQAAAQRKSAEDAKTLADAQRIAEQQALGLTKQSSKLVDEFDKVVKESGSVSEALDKLRKDLNFDDLSGVTAATQALAALGAQGKLSADQIKQAYSEALKNADLLKFETNARAAFASIKNGAEQLQIVLRALAEESLKRVGTSVLEVQTGFSSAMNSAINDTDRLRTSLKGLGADSQQTSVLLGKALTKEVEAANTAKAIQEVILRIQDLKTSGELVGPAMEASFKTAIDKAIELANTDKDLKRLEDQIQAIIRANPELANAFSDSVEKIKKKVLELDPVMKQVIADAELLGVKLQSTSTKGATSTEQLIRAYERLKASGKATAGEIQDAFVSMAEKAIKANSGIVPEWLKVEAAARGASIAIDEAGKATIKFANDSINALGQVNAQVGSLSNSYDELIQKQNTAANPPKGQTYDKDGFATDSSGNRITAGTYLPPPDNSGDWEWVAALNQGYDYGGYWQKKATVATGGKLSSGGAIYTGMTGGPRDGQFGNHFLGEPMANLGTSLRTNDHLGPTAYNGSGIAEVQKPADSGTDALNAAYDLLGMPSSSGAADTITAASAAFKLIMSDPTASIAAKREAFVRYAGIVLKANSGTVTGELTGYASQLGVDMTQVAHDANITTQGGLGKTTFVPSATGDTTGSETSSSGGSYRVDIVINGKPTSINAASASDANTLVNLLRSLGDAANRSGS